MGYDASQQQGMSKVAPSSDNTGGAPRGSGLLATKLYPRPARANLVVRPRITKLLDDGSSASLILMSAPAGFGKTTVLAEWLSAKSSKVAWLSLGADDNDPVRFWAYVILALQAIDDEFGETALAQLRSPQPPPVQQILPALLDEIDLLNDRAILVLDDYHVITSTAVNSSLTFFLENLAPNLHLVISTRSDPPIPLAKLRARGQVVEIRTDELRFTPDEAAAFLRQTMGLALSSEQVAALDERTEGWIAGLQMAALSVRGRDAERVEEFIRAFAGTNRFIMDYLLEEVLARESDPVRTFLLQTAILSRLTGPLVDAVTGASGGREMLEGLERRNLFVVSLEDRRIWYRYHHLFADLLRTQAQKSFGDLGVAALHLRAAEWYEQNGLTFEAIHHASLASDFERIERLIGQNYTEMMNRGEMSSIRFWTGKLNHELVYRRPWLCLYEAFSRSWFGQPEEASLLLDEAEKRIRSQVSAPDTRAMLGYHSYVQSRVSAMQGDTRRAIELCLAARENIPNDNLGLQIETGITLGYEYFLCGDFRNASKTLHEMMRSCFAVKAINNPVAAYALLARSNVIQGQLHDAYDLYQKAAQLIHEAGGQQLGAVGLVEVGIAALLCEWNDLEHALVRMKQGLDLLPLWGKADDTCLAYTTQARIQLAQGNRTAAAGTIEKAAHLVQSCGLFSEARHAAEAAQVKFWLVQGDRLAVDRWVASLERLGSHEPFPFEDELTRLMQARVYNAQNRRDEAIHLLSCLEEAARSSGRQGRLIEIMILKALAMQSLKDTRRAEIALTESLTLAEPEGYVRIFLDEGQPMQLLLAQCLAHTGAGPKRDYASHLLSQFAAEPQAAKASQKQASPAGGLVEPLSQRELEVLQLMSLGRTNQEIARQLIVARGTIKAHAASIFRKLDVANRTEAVARARQLGILP